MSLIVLLLLPFIGSCLAAVLPHNARNSESLLAGLIALVGTIQVAMFLSANRPWGCDSGRVHVAAQSRPEFCIAHGRVCLAVFNPGAGHRYACVVVRPLLHVT
jgi:hypothetical protein